jgi:hypothetical protein
LPLEATAEISDELSPSWVDNSQIRDTLQKQAKVLNKNNRTDFWLSDAGQTELLRRLDVDSDRHSSNGLSLFDYTAESKAMLCSAAPSQGEEEWIEVELTADTGSCDTVVPRSLCPGIPIQPSLQSVRGMAYEVADGGELPNLGEKRCVMWTENASEARHINMQVADVHKALLSLSRCADMGFESRFGRVAGALIDEETGEVVPLQRNGHFYVLKCWLKAAPFGRPVRG